MKIKIGCLTYTVKSMNKEVAMASGHFGTHDPTTQTITIEENVSNERFKEVLLHEIVHAIWAQYIAKDSAEEEEVATSLGYGLAALLRDNPKLKDILFNEQKR